MMKPEGYDYLEPKAAPDDISLGPWPRRQLLMSAAISAKRQADALELIAKHLAPTVDGVPEHTIREVDILAGESLRDAFAREESAKLRPWFLATNYAALELRELSDPIEVRYKAFGDIQKTPDRMPLGDAIEWSIPKGAGEMIGSRRRLKASIAEWRPL